MDFQITSLKEELHDMRNKYNELRDGNASKKPMDDDRPMCERQEVNYIHSEGYQNRIPHYSYYHHDPGDSEKSNRELNKDVKNDLEDFKRCIRSMRTDHDKLFDKEDHFKTDFEKSLTKFSDSQRVFCVFVKKNVNEMIINKTKNEKNFQTKIKNMERKMDEWEKSQNISFKQPDITDPPPPPAEVEHVNVVSTVNGKSDDPLKNQKDPTPSIVVNNKIKKDKSFKNYHVIETKEYPFREYIPKIPYPQRLKVDQSHLNRVIKES